MAGFGPASNRVMLALAASIAVGTVTVAPRVASAAGESSFVPITPCRLMDTRPAPATVGPKSTPLAAGLPGQYTLQVTGPAGDCSLSSTATAVVMNVTTVNATAGGFVRIYPADAPMPNTASTVFAAGQTAQNAVTVGLSTDGKVKLFNANGTVNVIADVVGYYVPAGLGPQGPQGPQGTQGVSGPQGPQGAAGAQGRQGPQGPQGFTGAQGPQGTAGTAGTSGAAGSQGPQGFTGSAGSQGPQGPQGTAGSAGAQGPQGDAGAPAAEPANVIWVATSGGDFTSVSAALASITDAASNNPYVIRIGPGYFEETTALTMKPYVDLQGSGLLATTLACACSGEVQTSAAAATVLVPDGFTGNLSLRDLTVSNVTTTGRFANAITVRPITNGIVLLDNVYVSASTNSPTSEDLAGLLTSSYVLVKHSYLDAAGGASANGILAYSGSVDLDSTSVTSSATGWSKAIRLVSSSAVVNNSSLGGYTATNAFGIANEPGSTADVRYSYVYGDSVPIDNDLAFGYVRFSTLAGGSRQYNTPLICAYVMRDDFTLLGNACQIVP